MRAVGKIRMKFTGRGTVKNPDGTERKIVLQGEQLVTEKEARKYGYHPGERS